MSGLPTPSVGRARINISEHEGPRSRQVAVRKTSQPIKVPDITVGVSPSSGFADRDFINRLSLSAMGICYAVAFVISIIKIPSKNMSVTFSTGTDFLDFSPFVLVPLASGCLLCLGSAWVWNKRLDRWMERTIDPVRGAETLIAAPLVAACTIAVNDSLRATEVLYVSSAMATVALLFLSHDLYNRTDCFGKWNHSVVERVFPIVMSIVPLSSFLLLWATYPTTATLTAVRVLQGIWVFGTAIALSTSVVFGRPKHYYVFNLTLHILSLMCRIPTALLLIYSSFPDS